LRYECVAQKWTWLGINCSVAANPGVANSIGVPCASSTRRAHRKWVSANGEADHVFPLMLGNAKIPPAFDDIQASRVDDNPSAPGAVIARIIALLSGDCSPRGV
jgi:hypothetical protein